VNAIVKVLAKSRLTNHIASVFENMSKLAIYSASATEMKAVIEDVEVVEKSWWQYFVGCIY